MSAARPQVAINGLRAGITSLLSAGMEYRSMSDTWDYQIPHIRAIKPARWGALTAVGAMVGSDVPGVGSNTTLTASTWE